MKKAVKNLTVTFLLALVLLTGSSLCRAEVVTYIPPEAIRKGNDFIMPSSEYLITVIQDGREYELFVYMMKSMHYTNVSKTTSWVNFSFNGEVRIRVTPLNGNVDYCAVLPSSRGISPEVTGRYVEFLIDRPGHFAVDFQRGREIAHPLLIFANPVEEMKPDPDNPDVIYFGPGIHEIGTNFDVGDGKWVYIDGGAYIKGQFSSSGKSGVRISGRGIVSGEDYPARTAGHMIEMSDMNELLIEGITMIHAPRFNIRVTGVNHVVRNVKMIGWWFSTDGIVTGAGGLVEDCFFKVNDDAIKVYNSNTTVRGCVIWQMENGAPFQLGWGGDTDVSGFRISDCDIIRTEHVWDNENLATFCAIHGGEGTKSDFVFEDIRIENSDWRIFSIVTRPNRWANWNPEKGSISNIVFRNITISGNQKISSIIRGHDINHKVGNITFENLKINGNYVTNAADAGIWVDPHTTFNIVFDVIKR